MKDLYGTHLELLKDLFKLDQEIYQVLEDGGGIHSTPFFLSFPGVCLTTVEEDEEWREKLIELVEGLPEGAEERWLCLEAWELGQFPDLVFIDGPQHTRGDRAQDAITAKARYIVLHDWENQTYYHYNKIDWPGYYVLVRVHTERGKETALWRRIIQEENNNENIHAAIEV